MLAGCLQSVFTRISRCWGVNEFDRTRYHRFGRFRVSVFDLRGVLTVAKGKRTFQPNNRRRARVHGFRLRMRTRAGRAIVAARRGKGRKELTA